MTAIWIGLRLASIGRERLSNISEGQVQVTGVILLWH